MDVGLAICRYGECLKITNGSCVPADGGSHHEALFRLVVFRPFVEEVCVGKIVKSTPEGIQVSLGFFQDIFIPAYWMLRPSRYNEKNGLWVWTPNYDDEEDEDDEGEEGDSTQKGDGSKGTDGDKAAVKREEATKDKAENNAEDEEDDNSFEMEIGAEIRFKVKSIQFTQVTNTAKGVQATTTTTDHSHSFPKEQKEKGLDKPLRKRSTSVDLSECHNMPASMHIVASICEDGLGLTSWWTSQEEEEEEAEEVEEGVDED